MKTTEITVQYLDKTALTEISGGGSFAYDAGWALRTLFMAGAGPILGPCNTAFNIALYKVQNN